MEHSVGQVAALAGVTVRTLHHYDEIGLLGAAPTADRGDSRRPGGGRAVPSASPARADRRAESAAIEAGFAEAMRSGAAPDSEPARALAGRHRAHISRWFYDCSPGIHRDLAEMYVADERFRGRYDAIAPGLAAYLRQAVIAAAEASQG